ncbi:Cell division and transport-associated protein TolA [Nitrosospira sp. Nsp18]|uniref:energy transducer TonB n=1 Tax=Nitrosospira sp. Nsp18 TaxID=1855334 RepID=UPI00088CB57F|nr:energy transducer TonB [Nitrosospira sp. Nsp18]SDA16777.1 Cell division and transport-associated protein TolA [Nitrosospira sp. Nsp18]
MALRKPSEIEPGAMRAGLLAVLVHVIFFAFMVFGLNWKTYPTEPVMVDLWSSLPPAVQPAIKAAPPLPEPKPVQPPPEAAPLPPRIETPPPPPKPDIALKEKIEKPKPVEKKPVEKKELVKKEQEQKERKEKERKEKEQKEQELKEQKARVAAEVAQLQREQQEANAKAQAKAAQAMAQSRLANEMAEYKAKILAKIRRNIVMPPDLPGNPVVEFDVTLLPGGDILDVRLRASSGFAAFDSAVERGIFLSKPLPLPPDPALFPKFRNLSVKVHYHE